MLEKYADGVTPKAFLREAFATLNTVATYDNNEYFCGYSFCG